MDELRHLVGPFHLIMIFPSALYHIISTLRNAQVYVIISRIMSILTIGIFIISAIYFGFSYKYNSFTGILLLLFLTAPPAIVSFSLLMILKDVVFEDTEKEELISKDHKKELMT
mmetsp:Transcript_20616/g.18256  ORF Transcript_20616/g.18256 Transcript_20616/m.18256 type:complete len:114 (+) Transcript_20616:95-436(+)